MDANFRLNKDLTSISLTKGTPFVFLEHKDLTDGIYNISISLIIPEQSVDTYQVFKVLIPTTIDSSRSKIFCDYNMSMFKDDDDLKSSFELRYDDSPDKGLVLVLLGDYSKTPGSSMVVKITKDL